MSVWPIFFVHKMSAVRSWEKPNMEMRFRLSILNNQEKKKKPKRILCVFVSECQWFSENMNDSIDKLIFFIVAAKLVANWWRGDGCRLADTSSTEIGYCFNARTTHLIAMNYLLWFICRSGTWPTFHDSIFLMYRYSDIEWECEREKFRNFITEWKYYCAVYFIETENR